MQTEIGTLVWMVAVVEKRFDQTRDGVHHLPQGLENHRLRFALKVLKLRMAQMAQQNKTENDCWSCPRLTALGRICPAKHGSVRVLGCLRSLSAARLGFDGLDAGWHYRIRQAGYLLHPAVVEHNDVEAVVRLSVEEVLVSRGDVCYPLKIVSRGVPPVRRC